MKVILADVPMFPELQADLDRLATTYESLDVRVERYPVPEDKATKDSVFLRDVAAWSPFKLIRPQFMGKESRRWESNAFFEWLYPDERDRNWYYWIPEGYFEGADVLFTTRRHVIAAIGSRSSEIAIEHITQWLSSKHEYFTNTTVYLPDWHEQHLLGLVNVVYGDNIYMDSRVKEECGEDPPGWVADAIALPHEEYHQKHTNWVQVNGKVVLNAAAVKTIDILRSRGIEVYPVDIPALVANGGGVACTTCILSE